MQSNSDFYPPIKLEPEVASIFLKNNFSPVVNVWIPNEEYKNEILKKLITDAYNSTTVYDNGTKKHLITISYSILNQTQIENNMGIIFAGFSHNEQIYYLLYQIPHLQKSLYLINHEILKYS